MKLASGELRDGFRGVGAQRVACGNEAHGGQPKRRGKLADAVEHLFVVVPFVLRIGSVLTETAMRGAWFVAIELRCLVGDCRSRTGKREAVNLRIRVADETESFAKTCFTALVDSFTDQQNRTAIARRLRPKLCCG